MNDRHAQRHEYRKGEARKLMHGWSPEFRAAVRDVLNEEHPEKEKK